MHEKDSPDCPTHKFEHISRFLPRSHPDTQSSRDAQFPPSSVASCATIIVATVIVLAAAPAALYFLVSEKFLYGFAALVTALGAAFGPKIYANFIQPKAPSAAVHNH
jgi:hypothetical protein